MSNPKTNGYKQAGRLAREASRRDGAVTRQSIRDQRSPEAQLALLDSRPGEARRERAKLSALLGAEEEVGDD